MTDQRDPVMAIVNALTGEQRDEIVQRFTTLNPRWHGAQAGDILDVLDQTDSDLAVTEPFFEATRAINWPYGAGVAARALIWSGQELTEENLRYLLTAAGLIIPHPAETVRIEIGIGVAWIPGSEKVFPAAMPRERWDAMSGPEREELLAKLTRDLVASQVVTSTRVIE